MSSQQPPPTPDSIAVQDKYLLHSPLAIQHVLQELQRRPELLTAWFDGGKGYLLTTLIAILPDRQLLVLEQGGDEAMNQRLLKVGQATCMARQQEIAVRFHLAGIHPARYQGERVFAAPLPESLYRLQRREYFRVGTPITSPLYCHLRLPNGVLAELPLGDLSVGGLSLLDPEMAFEAAIGDTFLDCTLLIPGESAQRLDLVVRNLCLIGEERDRPQLKIGFAFHQPERELKGFIQRYVNRLQLQQHQLAR